MPEIPDDFTNVAYGGNVTFSGVTGIKPGVDIVYDNQFVTKSYVNRNKTDQHFTGTGVTEQIVPLDTPAVAGSTELYSDTESGSIGGGMKIRKTLASETAGNWFYQENLNGDGLVESISARNVFDQAILFSVFYLNPIETS